MKKQFLLLAAILFAATSATAQTDTLVTMKSNADEVNLRIEWKPGTASVKANGVTLTNTFRVFIPVGADGTVVITTDNNAALTYLECSDNQLTQLNVEKSTDLAILYCDNNPLTQLNVDSNTALEWLYCTHNQLTRLNVDNNTALKTLICHNNQLSQLNVDNNTDLEFLSCFNNQLTELNVENNTALMYMSAHRQQIKVPLLYGAVSFPNPVYYKTSEGEDTVRIGTVWYAYGEDVPKVGTTMSFTTNPPPTVVGGTLTTFGGTITFVPANTDTDTLVTMKSGATAVRITAQWTPATATVEANGQSLTSGTQATIPVNPDSEVVITTNDNAYLTYLHLFDNKLTELNVENNPDLTYLRCNFNQLTELNVDKNTNLTSLQCGYNQLTELNVGNNTALIHLYCGRNQLTELNLENNTDLMWLECYTNQLTQLNVENNTALKALNCWNNQLTELNVEKNTNLSALTCNNNQLTELNVENNTILDYLHCTDNQLTQLNVDKNTALKTLNCENNQLTQLNVEKNTDLTDFSASGQQIEVPLSEGGVSFPNPVYYKTSAGEDTVRIGTEWYAYGEDVQKVGETMSFTTNPPAGVGPGGSPFGGTITFVPAFAVAFESNGGTAVGTQTVKPGNTVPEPANPAKSGYIFEAWYADADFTTVWNFQTDVVTSDITLYAKWTEVVVGINEVETLSLSIYPNPTTGILYINSPLAVQRLVVSNLNGQVVLQQDHAGNAVDISSLPKGVYLLMITTNAGESVQKVIKN